MSLCLKFIELYISVTRCNDGNNGGCGNKDCVQMELGVSCTCNPNSAETNMLARGKNDSDNAYKVLFFKLALIEQNLQQKPRRLLR